ncbi:hypothetical protein CHARACLAT_027721 [Characodon lateralis]|uniref:Uncharacterized protein n=1 Tax=Characodon lateralis TaxID=208331 RepID=A0ABU7DAL1_9TELE|nr:hypothetical protein [Characodon lateralis]
MVVISEVLCSQRLTEAPLKSWVILQASGKVESVHCSCMAVVAESCLFCSSALEYYIFVFAQSILFYYFMCRVIYLHIAFSLYLICSVYISVCTVFSHSHLHHYL